MGLNLVYINGQTQLEEDEKVGLLIETIATRAELDEFEQQNIEEAIQWVLGRNFKPETIFTESFIRNLHKRMYKNVWSWAGVFRKTDKNLGIDKWLIPTELRKLCEDTLFWIEHQTYDPDEITIRFKHRLVRIHCFPNGNGRHSRLMADIIIDKIFNKEIYTWGAENVHREGKSRTNYLKAIWEADQGKFQRLLKFARS
jgi:Fic-DOC domain mobile mystery protein B